MTFPATTCPGCECELLPEEGDYCPTCRMILDARSSDDDEAEPLDPTDAIAEADLDALADRAADRYERHYWGD